MIDLESEIKKILSSRKNEYSEQLYSAMEYALFGGGKRIRPTLCFLSAEFCDIDPNTVLPIAIAIEFIHSYSLVHDDLPCMDNDKIRRGKPTVHVVYGETMALLCGDALLNMAYEILFDVAQKNTELLPSCNLIATLAGASGMIGGQAMEFDGTILSEENLFVLDGKKTGKLIEAAVVCPALLSYSTDKISALSSYAKYAGLAFQLADDLLDAEKNEPSNFVTVIGKDRTLSLLASLRSKTESLLSVWGEKGKKLMDYFNLLAFRDR